MFLDHHQVWQSHDPTSIQNFDFCEEKSDYPPFFILHLFIVRIFFLSFKKMQLMEFLFIPSAWLSAQLSALYLPGYPTSYLPVI